MVDGFVTPRKGKFKNLSVETNMYPHQNVKTWLLLNGVKIPETVCIIEVPNSGDVEIDFKFEVDVEEGDLLSIAFEKIEE